MTTTETLMIVDYDGGDGDNGEWVVQARETEVHDWSTLRGDNLDELLSIARDIITGG